MAIYNSGYSEWSFVLSGLLAVAYFMVHAPHGFWPILNHGELAALYSFVFLYLAAAGGGPWAVDRLWRGKTSRPSLPTEKAEKAQELRSTEPG